jgi:hypothetical protein
MVGHSDPKNAAYTHRGAGRFVSQTNDDTHMSLYLGEAILAHGPVIERKPGRT